MTEVAEETQTNAHPISADKLQDTAARLRQSASEALSTAKTRASDAISDARTRSSNTIADTPLATLISGIALGAVIGGLLPRTQREEELLAPVGNKISEGARSAMQAARNAGTAKLDELGLTSDSLKSKVEELLGNIMTAVTSASDAASQSIKENKPTK